MEVLNIVTDSCQTLIIFISNFSSRLIPLLPLHSTKCSRHLPTPNITAHVCATTHTCAHTHVHTHTPNIPIHGTKCVLIYTHVDTHIRINAHTYVLIQTYTCTHTRTCMHTHAHACTHTHTHTNCKQHAYAHAWTHMVTVGMVYSVLCSFMGQVDEGLFPMGREKKEQHKYNIVIDCKLICWICDTIALRDNLTPMYDNSSLCMYWRGRVGEL